MLFVFAFVFFAFLAAAIVIATFVATIVVAVAIVFVGIAVNFFFKVGEVMVKLVYIVGHACGFVLNVLNRKGDILQQFDYVFDKLAFVGFGVKLHAFHKALDIGGFF